MSMEALEASRKLTPIALSLFPGSDVYMFGSQAKGCAAEASDIDFAVLLPADVRMEPRERFDKAVKLSIAAARIDLRIEPVVRRADDRTGFVHSVVTTGIKLS